MFGLDDDRQMSENQYLDEVCGDRQLRKSGDPFQQETQQLLWDWCQKYIDQPEEQSNASLEGIEKVLQSLEAVTRSVNPGTRKMSKSNSRMVRVLKTYDKMLRFLKVVVKSDDPKIDVEIDRYRIRTLLDCFEFVTSQLS